jgi:DNA-binding transcriptional LysR family regulator
MEFHQLRYFIAAAESLSISRAAERLHVTQPALSRQIAALEGTLGAALFERLKQRIHLSEAGRFFLPKARQLVCDAETSAQQVREQFGDAPRTLRLGFLSVFLDDLVAPVLREFRQRHPKARVSLFDLPPRAQLDRLRARELDVAILANLDDGDREHFSVRRLSRHAMAAVVPDDHPLATKKSLKLSALASDPWISLADAFYPGRREFLREICAQAGFEPRLHSEVDSLPLLLTAVAAGDGVAILPGHARKIPHAGAVFVRLASPAPTTELLLAQAKGIASPELATLVELIAEQAKGMAG